jgi:tetratricopeptide (TPR) repeat protein
MKEGNYSLYMQAVLLANASGRNQELVHITEEALQSYPDSADLRFFRGIGLYGQASYEALVANLDSTRFEDFSQGEYESQSWMLYAEALYRLEEFDRSDSLFEALIRNEPDNYMVMNNYSYYLAERGEKLEEAWGWSKTAIEQNPDNATFLDTHAWVLFKLGRLEEAEFYILKALEKGGENDAEINEHAGDIQKALDSPVLARSYYLKAIILGGERERLEHKIKLLEKENE